MKRVYDLNRLHNIGNQVFLTRSKQGALRVSTKLKGVELYLDCGHEFETKNKFKQSIEKQLKNDGFNSVCPKCKSNLAYTEKINNSMSSLVVQKGNKSIGPHIPQPSDNKEEGNYSLNFTITVYNEFQPFATNAITMRFLEKKNQQPHPNLETLYGTSSLGARPLKITTLMHNFTLREFVQKYPPNSNNDRQYVSRSDRVFKDISNAIRYLHSMSIVHGNISWLTILVDVDVSSKKKGKDDIIRAVLAKYDSALLLIDNNNRPFDVNPPPHLYNNLHCRSPELLFSMLPQDRPFKTEYSNVDLKKADLWSFGETMLDFIVKTDGKSPFFEPASSVEAKLESILLAGKFDEKEKLSIETLKPNKVGDDFNRFHFEKLGIQNITVDAQIARLLLLNPSTRTWLNPPESNIYGEDNPVVGKPMFDKTFPTTSAIVNDANGNAKIVKSSVNNTFANLALNILYFASMNTCANLVAQKLGYLDQRKVGHFFSIAQDLFDKYRSNFVIFDQSVWDGLQNVNNSITGYIQSMSASLEAYFFGCCNLVEKYLFSSAATKFESNEKEAQIVLQSFNCNIIDLNFIHIQKVKTINEIIWEISQFYNQWDNFRKDYLQSIQQQEQQLDQIDYSFFHLSDFEVVEEYGSINPQLPLPSNPTEDKNTDEQQQQPGKKQKIMFKQDKLCSMYK